MTAYPGFLTPDWFCPRNAGLLRDHIRALLHRLMAQQAEAQKAPQVARLMELADEHEARDHRLGVGAGWGGVRVRVWFWVQPWAVQGSSTSVPPSTQR